MVRRYGWGPSGERLLDAAPAGHWRTTTFVAGLRSDGGVAPFVLDGPMTGEVFRAYVEQMLAPALLPGDVVVMDNLPAHKVAGIQEAIRAVGASILYLPGSGSCGWRLMSRSCRLGNCRCASPMWSATSSHL